MSVPNLTDEQRKAALEIAIETRTKHAKLKKAIKEGKLKPSTCLYSDDPLIYRMKVYSFLKACPNVWTKRARQIMDEMNIPPSRRLKGLGKNQKIELISRLEKVK